MPDDTPIFTQPLRDMRQTEDELLQVGDATDIFEDGMMLRLEVKGSSVPILLTPTGDIVMGRRDPLADNNPDLDLTPYAGYQMGISRRHATLRLRDKHLEICDLDSKNGTRVNGQKVSAHAPQLLKHGDEIRLGTMIIRLYFQQES
jgi:hypothetical protein